MSDPDADDDGAPIRPGDRMSEKERARFWALVNHAPRPWMCAATEYPLPEDWTS